MKFLKTLRPIALVTAPIVLATVMVAGQSAPTPQQGATFRSATNYVTTDVIVRDREGRFIPDLKMDEFRVFEDGIPQQIATFAPAIGGRVFGNVASTPVAPAPMVEGLVLPPTRPASDTSGRIFLILIDDLHLQPLATPSVKQLLATIRDTLVHENDLVGFVSTGTSSIASDLSYDIGHRRFNEAIAKTMGGGLSIEDLITGGEGAEGPTQVRYMAHTAFRTAHSMLEQLAAVTNRRKSFIYISNGYDFNPMKDSRYKYEKEKYWTPMDSSGSDDNGDSSSQDDDPEDNEQSRKSAFSFADLVGELAELVRAAQRANVAFYTIDPRGLMGPDGDAFMSARLLERSDLADFMRNQVSSLQVLAEETGGFAVVNTNDFKGALQRIDNETSDYYILGYYSSNPDPLRIRRQITVEVTRPGVEQNRFESEYSLRRNTPRR